ncbi:MAG: hypothetical protein KKD28_07405 [Chloroflexi bacterium]|nr:hypothetical protein [Chloroflexota bacterium]MBU1661283.1 hypothetical protein [Chloroflexota bacterium]
MKETDKLRVLIPHWIEHNQEHANEFLDWAWRVDQTDEAADAIADVRAAAESMKAVNTCLQAALEKLGGPLEYDHGHDHGHDHDHDHDHDHEKTHDHTHHHHPGHE